MKWTLIFLVGFLFSSLSRAQNWQTVNQFDTNYFSAGEHSSSGGRYFRPLGKVATSLPTSSLLRISYVTNVVGIGGDSSFFFFKTLRDTAVYTPSGNCVDTVALSWLGSLMLRKPNGDELYFNSYRDTIFIPTQSTFGSSWILAKDTAGKIFRGSITAMGTLQVDGALDSFKTISIQEYSGTTPIANPYNNKILQLSKAHGWLQTLDFFRFPNKVYYSDDNPIATDSTQHYRLPKMLMYPGPNTEDLVWKYATGNEWIWQDERDVSNNPDATPQLTIVTHDSVTAFSLLSPRIGLATFKSVKFWKYHVFVPPSAANPTFSYNDSIANATIVHTDTVRSIPSASFVFIEHGNLSRYNYE